MKPRLVLIAHDIRSCHNVGSLLRTADGLGVSKVYLTGYTPYPAVKNDERLPHIAAKNNRLITKTSLGAEKSVKWEYRRNLPAVVEELRSNGFKIIALEQAPNSINLPDYESTANVALIIGSEVGGIDAAILNLADEIIEIPMLGKKESLNVSVAAAIALYHLRYS